MEEHRTSIDPEIEKNEKKEPAKRLKELRESRGVSLRSIIEKTKLSPSMIEAIETGDFHRLPEPVYTRAFLKAYARALNIDSEEILAGYETYLAESQLNELVSEPSPEEKGRPSHRRLVLLIVLFVCVLSFAVFYFMHQDNRGAKERGWLEQLQSITLLFDKFRGGTPAEKIDIPNVPQNLRVSEPLKQEKKAPAEAEKTHALPAEEKKTESGNEDRLQKKGETADATPGEDSPEGTDVKAAEELSGQSRTATTESAAEVPSKMTVEIRATDLSWVQIIKDSELPEELFLKAGETVTRDGDKKFDIIVGNAGGVEVQFQGKSLGVLGKKGEVVFLTLPDDVKTR